MKTMKEIYDRSMSRTAFTLTSLAISGGIALLLAAVDLCCHFVRGGMEADARDRNWMALARNKAI
jgi:hypothetical protein